LDCVDAGIRVRHSRVGDVLKAHFRAEVVLLAEKVRPETAARREIDLRSSFGDVFVAKKHATFNLEERVDLLRRAQDPLKRERVDTGSVRGIRLLRDNPYWHDVKRIFELPLEKTGAVWGSEDQTVTQTQVPHASS